MGLVVTSETRHEEILTAWGLKNRPLLFLDGIEREEGMVLRDWRRAMEVVQYWYSSREIDVYW